jgi:crotonobetainyl-CoA:carnitine CoA-transferase CaiB-like acyl-CoA transferase
VTLLDGIRVLDLSIWRPGPYATQLLVELGAEVLKVEPPGGDPMRSFPDLFAVLNAGKRAGTVDLKDPAGRAEVLERARDAQVVVEGFRPGVVARLGVDEPSVRAVNPTVVYCSVSGYGQTGPRAELPGHDIDYQAWAGTLEPRAAGEEPVVARPPIADLAGGAYAAMAICAALVRGEGESIDVSMTDVLASWTGPVRLPMTGVTGYGTFRARDGGWVALGVISEDHLWTALAEGLGLDDVAALTYEERMADRAALTERIEAAVGGRDRDELVTALGGSGVPIAPVLSQDEMLADGRFRAREHPLRYRDHPAVIPGEVPPLREVLPGWTR